MERNSTPIAEYDEIPKARVGKLQGFINSANFHRVVLKERIASSPMWEYIQQMGRKPKQREADGDYDDQELSDAPNDEYAYISTPGKLNGGSSGQSSFLNEAWRIMGGADDLADYFLSREESGSVIRLEVWRGKCASSLY